MKELFITYYLMSYIHKDAKEADISIIHINESEYFNQIEVNYTLRETPLEQRIGFLDLMIYLNAKP